MSRAEKYKLDLMTKIAVLQSQRVKALIRSNPRRASYFKRRADYFFKHFQFITND